MVDTIQARLILEILGRPASNVTDALNTIIDKIGKEKGTRVVEKKVHEPLPVKDVADLYSSFAEITIECESLSVFFGIVFAYMPSNIEIMTPNSFSLQAPELSSLANKILARLHSYDAITRRLVVDNANLKRQLGLMPPKQGEQQQSAQPNQAQQQVKEDKPKSKHSKSKKKSAKKRKK